MSKKWYDPEAERTCRGCHKCLKTKEGVLESGKFACVSCHSWYKKKNAIESGLMYLFVVIFLIGLFWGLIWFVRYVIKGDKKKDDE